LIAGVIAHFVVSLSTPRRTDSFEEIVEEMHQSRKAIEEASVDKHSNSSNS